MGIPKQVLKHFLHENKFRPMNGKLITFGRQTVGIDNDSLERILNDAGLSYELSGEDVLDSGTRHRNKTINDKHLFSIIGCDEYNCMDVSDYEGANIIHDLNYPIDSSLENAFDIVYTGGCLDNVFNPVSLLINSSKLLKPGGRVFHYESFQGVLGAYLYFSPEWFYSYYATNNFVDVKVYVCHQKSAGRNRFDYDVDLYLWQPNFTRCNNFDYFKAAKSVDGIMYCMVVAEKGLQSTEDIMPIQLQYIDSSGCHDWRKYVPLGRPIISIANQNEILTLPFTSDHFVYVGSNY